jgi:DNA-binding CsgD family transcriptional regulator
MASRMLESKLNTGVSHRSLWDEYNPSSYSDEQRERVHAAIEMLPATEIDMIDLVMRGVTQEQIGEHFGLTQAGVSYRLMKARRRIKWILERPPRPETLEDDLRDAFAKCRGSAEVREQWLAMVLHLSESTSQALTARVFNVDPTVPRNNFRRALKRLEILGRIESYRYLATLNGNWNILHEVVLPKWTEEGRAKARSGLR